MSSYCAARFDQASLENAAELCGSRTAGIAGMARSYASRVPRAIPFLRILPDAPESEINAQIGVAEALNAARVIAG